MNTQRFEGIETLYLFRHFKTRAEYDQARKSDPTMPELFPWNPYREPKHWFDPTALASQRNRVVYDLTVIGHTSDKPIFDFLVLSKDEAASVNIPPTGDGATNIPGADKPEIPVPLKAPGPNQRIVYSGMPPTVRVENLDIPLPGLEAGGGLTPEEHDLLVRIAAKLGA